MTIPVGALLTPPRRLDQGPYKVLGWVQGMSLHVWDEKKFENVDLDHRSKGVAQSCISNMAERDGSERTHGVINHLRYFFSNWRSNVLSDPRGSWDISQPSA